MKTIQRIITFMVLLISLCTLTGITQVASALCTIETSSPCCPDENPNNTTLPELPCSAPDCPCSTCQVIDLHRLDPLHITFHGVLMQASGPRNVFPAGFVRAIEYPPETVRA